jgi:hypothetical protein
MNTSMQIGTALGTAIASSVAVSHSDALLRTVAGASSALAACYQHALWVLGAIAFLALPLTYTLLRVPNRAARTTEAAAREAVAATN